MKRSLLLGIALLVSVGIARTQSQLDAVRELRVELTDGTPGPQNMAVLESARTRRKLGPFKMSSDGVFRFTEVPYGDYRLIISDAYAHPLMERTVAVDAITSTIAVTLGEPRAVAPISGTTSVSQLQSI